MTRSRLTRSLLIRIGERGATSITVQDLGTGERLDFASWEAFLHYADGPVGPTACAGTDPEATGIATDRNDSDP